MSSAAKELEKNGIEIICPVNQFNINAVATYVANSLCSSFPELNLNFDILFNAVSTIPMYFAKMPENMTDACYYYKTTSVYFRQGVPFETLKKLALHECIHHLQEVRSSDGELKKLGLCKYVGNRAKGNALNEAAVQYMSAYSAMEEIDEVTYYGITLPTPSPDYYPLITNLIKQVGLLTGYKTLFDSTFFANEKIYEEMKNKFGIRGTVLIRQNFDKLLKYEDKINKVNVKIQTEDLSYKKLNRLNKFKDKCKEHIQRTFMNTQNIIISNYFDSRIKELRTTEEIEEYRQYLYGFNSLVGKVDGDSFFSDFYIQKMTALDNIYERITNDSNLVVVHTSKLQVLFKAIKNLFIRDKDVQIEEVKE